LGLLFCLDLCGVAGVCYVKIELVGERMLGERPLFSFREKYFFANSMQIFFLWCCGRFEKWM